MIRSGEKRTCAGIADKIYSLNPDLMEVLPRGAEFLPYAPKQPCMQRFYLLDKPVSL